MTVRLRGAGPRTLSMQRDEEGHRIYKIKHLVEAGPGDGPLAVLFCPGLPVPGNYWAVSDDIDIWAWCHLDADVKIHQEKEGDPAKIWAVEQTFSTKPVKNNGAKCAEQQFDDPLLEPQKVSGSFVKFTEEATLDRWGFPITNSAHERYHGNNVEFDASRPNVKIQQNVANLQLDLLASMIDTLNDATLWGLPSRCVKLSQVSWERKYHGLCYKYYTRTLEFDINYNTFDKLLVDEGSMCLRGKWITDRAHQSYGQYLLDEDIRNSSVAYLNPRNFIKFKDWNGEKARTLLTGSGRPYDPGIMASGTGAGTGTGNDIAIGSVYVQKYNASNLLLLGIPTSF